MTAIKTLRDAREDEATAEYVQNAVSILRRYVTAADQIAARNAGAPKGAATEKERPHSNITAAGKATDDQILQAFSLARDLMSTHPPPLFKTVILKVEEATGLKGET